MPEPLIRFLTDPLFLILVAFIVLMAVITLVRRQGRQRAWKQLEDDLGFRTSRERSGEYQAEVLSGTYRGREVRIAESVTPDGRNRRAGERNERHRSTDISLKVNDLQGAKFRLYRVLAIGGVKPVTGDESLDRNFTLESTPPELVRQIMTSINVRQRIMELKNGGTITGSGREICYSQSDVIPNGNYLRFLLDFLSDVADAIDV